MKYIFLDTNIFLFSALSTQSEHKIESFEKIKKVLSKKKAILVIPDIVTIEFERNIEDLYPKSTEFFDKLKDSLKNAKVQKLPLIEDEKKKLLKAVDDILKERRDKYERMAREARELFVTENVEQLKLTPEVFINAYLRCEKRVKPFKKKDGKKIELGEDFYEAGSAFNDVLIVESIIEACKNKDEHDDILIFCSDNIVDFAFHDKKENRHNLHPDIKKDIKLRVNYYRSLPDMLEKEFNESISEESKKGIETAKKEFGRYLNSILTEPQYDELLDKLKHFVQSDIKNANFFIDDFNKPYPESITWRKIRRLAEDALKEKIMAEIQGEWNMTNDYQRQRIEGVKLIDEEIRRIAKEYNIEGIEVEWDRGEKIVDRDFHILKVSCRGVTVEARLSDENVADFPGEVGTETTKGIIKKLILDLKHTKGVISRAS